jgi:Aldehyde dehydrogenase family
MASSTTCSNEPFQGSLSDHFASILRILFGNKDQNNNGFMNSSKDMVRTKIIAVIFIIVFVALFALHTLWNAYHMSYHLTVWYEYLFLQVPDITIPNLPTSVTDEPQNAEIKTETTTDHAKRPSLIDPSRPDRIQCYDPSTDAHLGEVVAMTSQQVHECCVRASLAQKSWSKTTFAQRRMVLRTIQRYIVQHAQLICQVSAKDSGKPIMDGYLGEILTTTEKIRTICSMGEIWLLPSYRTTGLMFCYKIPRVEYVPYGIIAPIAPWNYPYVHFFTCC